MSYETMALGLQGGDQRCGFWTVFIGWLLLLKITPNSAAVRELDGTSVASKLAACYEGYLNHEDGLPGSVVLTQFTGLGIDPEVAAKFNGIVSYAEYVIAYVLSSLFPGIL